MNDARWALGILTIGLVCITLPPSQSFNDGVIDTSFSGCGDSTNMKAVASIKGGLYPRADSADSTRVVNKFLVSGNEPGS